MFDSEAGVFIPSVPSNRRALAEDLKNKVDNTPKTHFYNQLTGKREFASQSNLKKYNDALNENIVKEFFDLASYRESDEFHQMNRMRQELPTNSAIAGLIKEKPDGSTWIYEPNLGTLRMALRAFQGRWIRYVFLMFFFKCIDTLTCYNAV